MTTGTTAATDATTAVTGTREATGDRDADPIEVLVTRAATGDRDAATGACAVERQVALVRVDTLEAGQLTLKEHL